MEEDNQMDQWDVKAAFINALAVMGKKLYISSQMAAIIEGREDCVYFG
jgi:hypothetical protein